MGQSNLFEGVIARVAEPGKPGAIDWRGRQLDIVSTGHWRIGERVAWMVLSESVVMHRRGRPSQGERENPVGGLITNLAVLGEQTAVTLRLIGDPDAVLNFRLPTHAARRNELQGGCEITVSLLSDGLHLMSTEK
jgi:molybdate transport system ATP-binding protein